MVSADPLTSAKRLNKQIAYGQKVYEEKLHAFLKVYRQDDFVVGMEPPKNVGERIAALRLQLPQALEIAADPNQDPATRVQAWRIQAEYLQLMRQEQGSSGAEPKTES